MTKTPLDPGDIFLSKYRVDRVLGKGAMGLVVAATHIALGQRVAVKFMLPSKSPDEQLARFLREARASVHLKTPHIAKVLDFGSTPEGAPYMIMEHLDGRDLAAEIQARGQLPIDQAVELILQACHAVAEAHVAGIVHRDIKPANLFLTTSEGMPCVKVLDFGISKVADDKVAVTGDMHLLGSPLYMSPEQVRATKNVDARSDIWALGVTLYELVTGWTPFHGDQIAIVLARLLEEPPTPLAKYRADVPPGFEAVLRQCLEKDRERRYPNVATFVAALAPYASERAAPYIPRIAAMMGEAVAPSRPTDVGLPEPALTAAPAGSAAATMTGSAVARTASSGPARRSGVYAMIGLGAAAVLGLVGVATLWTRGPGPSVPGAAGGDDRAPIASSSAPVPALTASATPDTVPSATTLASSAPAASAVPAAPSTSATTAPPVSRPMAPKAPPSQARATPPRPAPKQPAQQAPSGPSPSLYDRGTKR